MAQIVCVIGNKGGTGKTTLSHMLCQGLGLLGQRAACVLTDVCRQPLIPDGRRYITADARTPVALDKVVAKLRTLEHWLGVIDGGGNRTEMDRKLYAISDLVLLPFRESHEDLRTVMQDLEQFPRAFAVPSQWPTNSWQRSAADRAVGELLRPYRHRILHPVGSLSASKLLLQKRIPEQIPTQVSNACRAFARQVLELLEIDLGDDEAADSPMRTTVALDEDERPMRLRGQTS